MNSRTIEILKAIQGGTTYDAEALSRSEAILKAICNNTAYTDPPQSKYEKLLLAIKNGTTVADIPQTRLEEILTAIANGTLEDCLRIKGLLKYPYVDTSKTANGINFTDNKDGTITANGTATGYATFILSYNTNFENNKTYIIAPTPNIVIQYTDNGETKWARGERIKWQEQFEFERVYIQIDNGITVTNQTYKPYIFAITSEIESAYIAAANKLKR